MTPLRKVVMTNPSKDVLEVQLKEEKKFRETFFSKSTPILPGSLFLAPNNEIITRPVKKPLFPEFANAVEAILPAQLPFDITLLHQDIYNFFHPAFPTVEEWKLIPQDDDVKQEATKKEQTDPADTLPENDGVIPPVTPGNDDPGKEKAKDLPPADSQSSIQPTDQDAKNDTAVPATDSASGLANPKDSTPSDVGGSTQTPEDKKNNNLNVPPSDDMMKVVDASHQTPTKDSTQTPPISDDTNKQVEPDKPGLKPPPKGSIAPTDKTPDKSSVSDQVNKKDPKEVDKEFDAMIDDWLSHPHKGGKHLHRTDHELNQTATETEDDESEPEQHHDLQDDSIHGTPVGLTTGSLDEEYLEPENVEAVKPTASGKKGRKQKSNKGTDTELPTPAPKKQ